MRRSFFAFLIVLVQCVLASKANATDDPRPFESVRSGFSSTIFKFVAVVPDDGQGIAGGWQDATPSGLKIPVFTESDFPFVTVVADDGRDPSGGWQQAKANLEFTKVVIPSSVTRWKCPITIQIPIRHSTRGYISPSRAASMSVLVTNVVTVNMDFDLPQGIFCNIFVNEVRDAFPILLPNLGARVTK